MFSFVSVHLKFIMHKTLLYAKFILLSGKAKHVFSFLFLPQVIILIITNMIKRNQIIKGSGGRRA